EVAWWVTARNAAASNAPHARRLTHPTTLPAEARFQPRVERIVAGEHVVERRHRDGVGAALAQQPGERVHVVGRTVQGEHVGGGAIEWRDGAEALLRLGDEGVVAERHVGAHLAERVGAALRRDAVEDGAGGGAGGNAPVGPARRDEVRLRTQDEAVLHHLEGVGGERRAGGGDVDDQLGGAGGGRRFGGAGALHDAVV